MTKVTYRKNRLFGLMVLEGLESILVGSMTATFGTDTGRKPEISHAESQENSERQSRHTGNDTRL